MKMQTDPTSKKDLTFRNLSSIVLHLEIEKGHLKWKVTDIERKSKLSRSLVYRYLGSSKEEILRNALQIFTHDFYGFGTDKLEIPFFERVARTREFVIENPNIILFYLRARNQDSWLSGELAIVEKKFQKKLKKLYPLLTDEEVLQFHASIHGIVTAPFLTAPQARALAHTLEKSMQV